MSGITFYPGKHQPVATTGAWSRDLDLDLRAIRDCGAAVLGTLVTLSELRQLQVTNLGEAAEASRSTWLHLPIPDVSTPALAWEQQWARDRGAVHRELGGGGRVVVHCMGGLGRAGVVACLILMQRGMAAGEALRVVRIARPYSVETAAQEAYVAVPHQAWSVVASRPWRLPTPAS